MSINYQATNNAAATEELKILASKFSVVFPDGNFDASMSAAQIFGVVSDNETRSHVHEAEDRIKDIESHADKRIGFQKGFGSPSHAYIAHSLGDVVALQKKKMAIAIVHDKISSEIADVLKWMNVAALIVESPKMTGHLNMQIGPFGVSTLIAPDTIDAWKSIKEIPTGTPITISPIGNEIGLYEKHLEIVKGIPLSYSQDIVCLYRSAAQECNLPYTQFKANIDALDQIKNIFKYENNGIGLVRTEHFALLDKFSRTHVKIILMGSTDDADYHNLRVRQDEQMTELFSEVLLNRASSYIPCPVRIRLLDAPPDEFMDQNEYENLKQIVTEDNMRGVQMALARHGLYENQIDAIFTSYKELGEQRLAIGLEIMVPTVKTREELLAVKKMVLDTAQRHGIAPSEFKFGMMLETLEAVQNAKELAPHIDFVSIGSNDLTGAALGLSRTDMISLKKFRDADPDGKDPFITLHERVVTVITKAYNDIKEVNPSVTFSICGAQATDLDSLMKVKGAIKLDSASMPPSELNFNALQADFCLACYRQEQPQTQPFKAAVCIP
ncbi:MAG: aldolase/citrate lyase family protein [Bdellovibrionales bacterium]